MACSLSRRAAAALFVSPLVSAGQPAWKVVHQASPPITIADFARSESGYLAAAGRDDKPLILLSKDGGAFSSHPLPASPVSLCFAGERDLWFTSAGGLWRSGDLARTWKLAHRHDSLTRVYFVGPDHGYALGANKTVLETMDGGRAWNPLPAAAEPSTHAEYTTYDWVDFATPRVGVITGVSRPPRTGRTGPLPAWRDPLRDLRRPEWPSASITLETRDGGVTWKHSTTSLFGSITRVRYARDGRGLALIEFHDAFEYPSEVFSIDLRTGRSSRAFREKDRAVTDLLVFPGNRAVLAAIAPPPDPRSSTFGAAHFLVTDDFSNWTGMPIGAPLEAGRLWLAGDSLTSLWAVSGSGTILRFAP
ncbi:MAG: hypothetical protein IT166_03545 [Bryobacterales bacterium]|nr:hypothetical protein [Bryobacterales bacterium]